MQTALRFQLFLILGMIQDVLGTALSFEGWQVRDVVPRDATTTTISFATPSNVSTCQPLSLSWSSTASFLPFNVTITNVYANGTQVGPSSSSTLASHSQAIPISASPSTGTPSSILMSTAPLSVGTASPSSSATTSSPTPAPSAVAAMDSVTWIANVPPGWYLVTGFSQSGSIQFSPSAPFFVSPGSNVTCVPSTTSPFGAVMSSTSQPSATAATQPHMLITEAAIAGITVAGAVLLTALLLVFMQGPIRRAIASRILIKKTRRRSTSESYLDFGRISSTSQLSGKRSV